MICFTFLKFSSKFAQKSSSSFLTDLLPIEHTISETLDGDPAVDNVSMLDHIQLVGSNQPMPTNRKMKRRGKRRNKATILIDNTKNGPGKQIFI